MSVTIHHGDCRDVLAGMEPDSVHAVVTDPPYHLKNNGGGPHGKGIGNAFARAQAGAKSTGFMGKAWDGGDVAFDSATWLAVLRVMKPGAFLVAFGGTRTYHRLACAIEDAGFEIRDMIGWLYGSGFPKGTDKAKIPAEWQGWNTALKPAQEPICLARKPYPGTLADNLQRHGCGALNIEACRIETADDDANRRDNPAVDRQAWREDGPSKGYGYRQSERKPTLQEGRWPANVVHDGSEEVLQHFPDAPGQLMQVGPEHGAKPSVNTFGDFGPRETFEPRGDGGGSAARFFYCAKADREDRNDGCEELRTWESADHSHAEGALRQLQRVTSDVMTLLRDDSAWNTISFGSNTTARYRKAITSIIETITRQTTPSETLNFSPSSNISGFTRAAIETARANGSNLVELAEFTSRLPLSSMNAGMASAHSAVLAVLRALSLTSESGKRGNCHSTVKPTDLMVWLCKLVTPPGGVILDPFMGSGSTGRGAALGDFQFIGIEREVEYVEIARRRIRAISPLFIAA